jgi:hypothetical protein
MFSVSIIVAPVPQSMQARADSLTSLHLLVHHCLTESQRIRTGPMTGRGICNSQRDSRDRSGRQPSQTRDRMTQAEWQRRVIRFLIKINTGDPDLRLG